MESSKGVYGLEKDLEGVRIEEATVVNLVKVEEKQQLTTPPPLPPRPSSGFKGGLQKSAMSTGSLPRWV